MDSAMLYFGLVWALLGKGGAAPAPGAPSRTVPAPGPAPAAAPVFPGGGWQYDEPPPPAVKARARELLTPLWASGQGAHRVEQTGGRWIAYRAEITRGKKRGVVAYRRTGSSTPLQSRPPALPHALPAVYTSSPGIYPAATSAQQTIEVQAGKWYQFTVTFTVPSNVKPEDVAKGIASGGGVDIVVSREPPHLAIYVQRVKITHVIVIGVPITIPLPDGQTGTLRFDAVKEVRPAVPTELPPGVLTSAPAEPQGVPMRLLKFGMGMKPERPQSDVALLQVKLGINPADGRFGNVTKAAVRKYQGSHGLQVDGIVGPDTWRSIFSVRA